MFVLQVDDEILLRLHDAYNVEGFFKLIDRNRAHLRQWMEWEKNHQMEWEKNHQTVDDSYRYVMTVREQFARREIINAQIYYRGEIAGSVGLIIQDWYTGYGEVGYWLGAEFTGKGIATRAARAMVNFAFNTLELHKLVILHFV